MTVFDMIFPIVPMRDLQSDNEIAPGQECIANISREERLKRLIPAIFEIVLAIIILAVMMATGVDRLWRIGLFLLFAGAASGYFQWRDHT